MKTVFCLAFSLFSLIGCHSENTQSQVITPNTSNIVAFDKLATAQLNSLTSIDLTTSIRGQNAVISGVYSEDSAHCYAQTDGNSSIINIELYQQGQCDFVYRVQDEFSNTAQAKLIVVSSANSNPILPTISYSALVDSKNHTINLSDKFGADFTKGFAINKESLIIQSEIGAQEISKDELTIEDLAISFDATTNIGWHNISYQISDGSETKIGEILINIIDSNYPAPTISEPDFIYTRVTGVYGKSLDINLEAELCNQSPNLINGQGCLKIDKQDGLDWQLSNVKSMTAKVKPKAADNHSNKIINFTATSNLEGKAHHDVSYIVSNHYGASEMGMMRIYAAEKEIAFADGWKDITYSDHQSNFDYRKQSRDSTKENWTLSAPKTHIEALNSEFKNPNYQIEVEDKITRLAAIWNETQAKALCPQTGNQSCPSKENRGDSYRCKRTGLPSTRDLTKLRESNNKEPAGEYSRWSKKRYYFAMDNGKVKLFDLKTGDSPNLESGYLGYVSCVDYDFYDDD